jgi:hypothetical protein
MAFFSDLQFTNWEEENLPIVLPVDCSEFASTTGR